MQEKFYLFAIDNEGVGTAEVYDTRADGEQAVKKLEELVGRGYYAGEQTAWVLIQGTAIVSRDFEAFGANVKQAI